MASKAPKLADLDRIRADLADAQAALAELPGRPLPVGEAIERAAVWVDSQAAAFNGARAARACTEQGADANIADAMSIATRQVGEISVRADVMPMLSWAFGDQLKQRLSDEINALELSDPIAAAHRAPERQRLKAEIARLEVEEEVLIRQLEGNGEQVQRRADAPIEIIVAPDLELAEAA